MKISKEILNDLNEFVQDAYDLGRVYRQDDFYSIEKDIKNAFKIKKDFVLQTFSIQAGSVNSYKNIPLKCTISIDPESKNNLLHIFENLLTGERVDVTKRLIVENKVEACDQYEFWVVWLQNPNRIELQENYYLPVITRPLDIEVHKEIKMKI